MQVERQHVRGRTLAIPFHIAWLDTHVLAGAVAVVTVEDLALDPNDGLDEPARADIADQLPELGAVLSVRGIRAAAGRNSGSAGGGSVEVPLPDTPISGAMTTRCIAAMDSGDTRRPTGSARTWSHRGRLDSESHDATRSAITRVLGHPAVARAQD
jgi:hypothetical protein